MNYPFDNAMWTTSTTRDNRFYLKMQRSSKNPYTDYETMLINLILFSETFLYEGIIDPFVSFEAPTGKKLYNGHLKINDGKLFTEERPDVFDYQLDLLKDKNNKHLYYLLIDQKNRKRAMFNSLKCLKPFDSITPNDIRNIIHTIFFLLEEIDIDNQRPTFYFKMHHIDFLKGSWSVKGN